MFAIGGAVEALKSGEAVERDGFIYRYIPERRILAKTRDGVSSSVGALSVADIFAEDWKIHGYAQEFQREHAENHLPLGQTADPGDGNGRAA